MSSLNAWLLANADRARARKERNQNAIVMAERQAPQCALLPWWSTPLGCRRRCVLLSACRGEGADEAASGAVAIACVAFAPNGGGRKEGRLNLSPTALQGERRDSTAATTTMARAVERTGCVAACR